jgi:predicted enzyme related to lactoylglutathione lyase
VQAEYERLVAAGVKFTGEPTENPYGTIAVFEDGCGNLVQLHQD